MVEGIGDETDRQLGEAIYFSIQFFPREDAGS
jgi:hypothetical protein